MLLADQRDVSHALRTVYAIEPLINPSFWTKRRHQGSCQQTSALGCMSMRIRCSEYLSVIPYKQAPFYLHIQRRSKTTLPSANGIRSTFTSAARTTQPQGVWSRLWASDHTHSWKCKWKEIFSKYSVQADSYLQLLFPKLASCTTTIPTDCSGTVSGGGRAVRTAVLLVATSFAQKTHKFKISNVTKSILSLYVD